MPKSKFANQHGWRKNGEPGDAPCACEETLPHFKQACLGIVGEG